MARGKKDTDTLLSELRAGLEALVATARQEGHDEALAGLRALVGSGGAAAPKRGARKAAKPAKAAKAAKKAKKPRKNPWAGLSPEARLERVNAIRRGKGLPPKTEL